MQPITSMLKIIEWPGLASYIYQATSLRLTAAIFPCLHKLILPKNNRKAHPTESTVRKRKRIKKAPDVEVSVRVTLFSSLNQSMKRKETTKLQILFV